GEIVLKHAHRVVRIDHGIVACVCKLELLQPIDVARYNSRSITRECDLGICIGSERTTLADCARDKAKLVIRSQIKPAIAGTVLKIEDAALFVRLVELEEQDDSIDVIWNDICCRCESEAVVGGKSK